MNREEVTLLGFEIVAYAGDARSKLLEALKQQVALRKLTKRKHLCLLKKLQGKKFHTASQ